MRSSVLMIFAVCFALVGCGSDGGDGGGGTFSTSETCETVWECVNGVCECEDGTPCDDADDCDVVCEVCG